MQECIVKFAASLLLGEFFYLGVLLCTFLVGACDGNVLVGSVSIMTVARRVLLVHLSSHKKGSKIIQRFYCWGVKGHMFFRTES